MASLWRDQIYYLFGFLWLALNVIIIISSEVSIIVVYLCLCKGDYNWWWKILLYLNKKNNIWNIPLYK